MEEKEAGAVRSNGFKASLEIVGTPVFRKILYFIQTYSTLYLLDSDA
jgi:hypothetical protein